MARTLQFTKMNGAGNDFVLADNRGGSLAFSSDQIARICDRHRGVGADGLLLVEPAQNGADFRMRYYNADGGEAEMCGNGARCFARYVQRMANVYGTIRFETPAGVIGAKYLGDLVEITMSAPQDYRPQLAAQLSDGSGLTVSFLNTGVPHTVVPVTDLEGTDVRALGRELRFHSLFAPKGTNVNFLQRDGLGRVSIRTYERGVEDETLACGTGVVASALIHAALENAPSPVFVHVRGGETLEVGFSGTVGDWQNVTLKGPADFVFDGSLSIS
jgi:diaminopimelate epimerase